MQENKQENTETRLRERLRAQRKQERIPAKAPQKEETNQIIMHEEHKEGPSQDKKSEEIVEGCQKQEIKREKMVKLLRYAIFPSMFCKPESNEIKPVWKNEWIDSRRRQKRKLNQKHLRTILVSKEYSRYLADQQWKIFKFCRVLQTLQIDFHHHDFDRRIQVLCPRLQALHNLQNLRGRLLNIFQIEQEFRNLCRSLKRLKNFRTLTLDFENDFISLSIKYLPSLRRLEYYMPLNNTQSCLYLKKLLRSIKPSLQELHVRFDRREDIIDFSYLHFCSDLRSFSLETCPFFGEGNIQRLWEACKELRSLRYLDVRIENCSNLSLIPVAKLCMERESLKEVKLKFSQCKGLHSYKVKDFLDYVALIGQPIKFDFEFSQCGVTEAELPKFIQWSSIFPGKKFTFKIKPELLKEF